MLASTTAAVAANTFIRATSWRPRASREFRRPSAPSSLLPMAHPVLVGNVYVNFTIGDTFIDLEAGVDTIDRTGVEMEALTAVTVAALTIYDMCKSSRPNHDD